MIKFVFFYIETISLYDIDVFFLSTLELDIRKIWQMNIPLKMKFFMWFFKKGVILINLARRNCHGSLWFM